MFQHDKTYKDFQDSIRRTDAVKLLLIKLFILLGTQNMMDMKGVLLQRFVIIFMKIKNINTLNRKLAEEFHKSIIREFKKPPI